MTAAWRSPTLTFKCGACGTIASGFQMYLEVDRFAENHAKVCPGYPPHIPPPVVEEATT